MIFHLWRERRGGRVVVLLVLDLRWRDGGWGLRGCFLEGWWWLGRTDGGLPYDVSVLSSEIGLWKKRSER